MCYWVGTRNVRDEMLRLANKNPDDEIVQLFYKTFVGKAEIPFMEHYVAIGKSRPLLSVMLYTHEKGLHSQNMYWGLNWSYTDNKTGKLYEREMINSTCEKIFFVHKDVVYSQRCIIPIDGYYEFFHMSGQVYPHFLYPVDGIFYAGGVWAERVDQQTGELIKEFSIITTPPNALTQKLHNNPKSPNGSRMLLLLHPDRIMDFLNPDAKPDQVKDLFKPYPEHLMGAFPTVRFLKREFSDKLDTEFVRQKIDYPELFFA